MPAQPPETPHTHADAGDGVEKSVQDASQGRRSGRIVWVLGASLVLVVALFVIITLVHAPALNSSNARGAGSTQPSHADAAKFSEPEPSPKQAPPDMPSTTGQTTPDATNNAQ